MKDLLNEVNALTLKEYERAAEKYGEVNNSSHESYAIILEEFEECLEMIELARQALHNYWQAVKENEPLCQHTSLKELRGCAEHAATEMIQVAAMCHKALKGEKP